MRKLSCQTKKGKTTTKATPWTEKELELFAEDLADPENNFGVSLEKLALTKYSSISKIPLR